MNYEKVFIDRGLTLLDIPTSVKQKVPCIDKDGYKYFVSYDLMRDKRTKSPNKWTNHNPFKAYNMRLFASKEQDNVQILSSDEELMNSPNVKVRFVCPNCGNVYEKKWCHWIAQEKDLHFCESCMAKASSTKRLKSYKDIVAEYADHGFTLLSDYDFYMNNGGNSARNYCRDKDGYKYAISLVSLRVIKDGGDKFSKANPFRIENLQKYCDDSKNGLKIMSDFIAEDGSLKFVIKCTCGNLFECESWEITSGKKLRCSKCASVKESNIEYSTRLWLDANNIKYYTQYIFNDCRYKRVLPFDFFVDWHDRIILIEVDGQQHMKDTNWFGERNFEEQKIRDSIKTEYCKNHGYELVRIPYWDYQNKVYEKILYNTFFG